MADSFLLSQPFVDKLRSTIERVDGTPLPGAGGVKRGPILEDPGVQPGKVFRIAKFDGAWAKGATKTVRLQDASADGTLTAASATVTATNLFADVNSGGNNSVHCAIAKSGAAWFLIASEC